MNEMDAISFEEKESLSQILGNPVPLDGLLNIENEEKVPAHQAVGEKCDQVKNPNLNDNRRFFQVKPKDMTWQTKYGDGVRNPL